MSQTHRERSSVELLHGAAGHLEVSVDWPASDRVKYSEGQNPSHLAIVAHPHPLQGGTKDNKVATTLARAFNDLGFVALRPNFRGVGQSQGSFDAGKGETQDLHDIWRHFHTRWQPRVLALAGFSFGSFVVAMLAHQLRQEGVSIAHQVLVGTAAGRFDVSAAQEGALVVHGETDDVIALQAVLRWAEPQRLPVLVFPGVGHFFHGALNPLRQAVVRHVLAERATSAH